MNEEDGMETERLMWEGIRFEDITVEQIFDICYTRGLEATVDGDAERVFFSPLKEGDVDE
jgi:hypothetical protein